MERLGDVGDFLSENEEGAENVDGFAVFTTAQLKLLNNPVSAPSAPAGGER